MKGLLYTQLFLYFIFSCGSIRSGISFLDAETDVLRHLREVKLRDCEKDPLYIITPHILIVQLTSEYYACQTNTIIFGSWQLITRKYKACSRHHQHSLGNYFTRWD